MFLCYLITQLLSAKQKLVNSRKSSNNQEVSVLFLKSFSF
ncbi:hypothetical protein CWATWH0402_4163 [Crocosphaera watsonii WH 0402]|uniref:Uncharacterized protein n=1 Tax=Crocosphaera watsonii WH 0402 TaxID=1284629 RepID=T2JWZ2_CROWT|nr:hypothetical protein CWATWH0402_4163 [Crocosphaera watsonii WH 0402]